VLDEVLEFVWKDDHRMISVWNTTPILNEDGEVLGVLATSEDITDFVLQERQMKADKEFLEQIVAERNEEQMKLRIELERLDRLSLVAQMAASISHEVRNPIAIVRGFLQLMNNLQPTGQLSPITISSSEKHEGNTAGIDQPGSEWPGGVSDRRRNPR
jgi:signal transduction histidine kinase